MGDAEGEVEHVQRDPGQRIIHSKVHRLDSGRRRGERHEEGIYRRERERRGPEERRAITRSPTHKPRGERSRATPHFKEGGRRREEPYLKNPFRRRLANKDIPDGFKMPDIKSYDGTGDPLEHLEQIRTKLVMANVPPGFEEICMCRGLAYSLTGKAVKWFGGLAPGTIESFEDFEKKFLGMFGLRRAREKDSIDLMSIKKREDETLRRFTERFTAELMQIPDYDEKIAVRAFREAFPKGEFISTDLLLSTCQTMEQVMARVTLHLTLEDEREATRGSKFHPKREPRRSRP